MWDVCIRDWLCETKLGRSLLSCDARPRMKSRYWLSCVRGGGPLCTSLGYRPPIGCIFWLGRWAGFGGTERRFVYRNYRSIRTKGVATRDGWLCNEIGVVRYMSCEVELLYDHSGVKLTFWVFARVLSSSKRGCGRLLTVLDCGQVEYCRSVLYFDLP